jgi:hypothetical protein
MKQLTYDQAREIANNLKTLVFCPDTDGLKAIAEDLVGWCQGFQGWAPDQQAMWVVQEIRNQWDKWYGSKAMREMFDQKFTIHPPDPIEAWKKQGLKPDPTFVESILGTINGKSTPEQLDALRWESIGDALEYQGLPERDKTKDGRKFWPDFLFRMEQEHPTEVAAIRAGRQPEHPESEAYKNLWDRQGAARQLRGPG